MSAAQHVCERLNERLPYRHMILMNHSFDFHFHMKDWRTHEQDAALNDSH